LLILYIIENVGSNFYLLKYHIEPLPDIILDNVSYQQWGLDVSEILIMVSTFSAFMIAMLHSYRYHTYCCPRGLLLVWYTGVVWIRIRRSVILNYGRIRNFTCTYVFIAIEKNAVYCQIDTIVNN
jgi:hypothetical protein